MNKINNNYGICLQDCLIINRNLDKREQLQQGVLVQIIETQIFIDNGNTILIRLYNSDENSFKIDLFECAKQYIGYIEDALWAYMIGSSENNTRIRIYNERDLVLQLKCGTEITINSLEDDSNANIKGVVQLIKTIKENGIGNFIGLKILNPPENRQTLLNLYKTYYNATTSLFLFRVDQLLDAIKNSNIKSERWSPRASAERDGRVENPIVRQQVIINPLIKSKIASSSSGAPPSYQIIPVQGDIKSTPDLVNTTLLASGSNRNFSPVLSSIQYVDGMQHNQSRIDYPSDLNGSSDMWTISKPDNGSNVNNLVEAPIYSLLKSSKLPNPNDKASFTSAQLMDVPFNEQRLASNRNKPVDDNKTRNDRFTQIKKNPKNIGFRKGPTYRTENDRQKRPHCHICRSPFDRDALILRCRHYMCVKCVGTNIASVIGTSIVRCPFVSNSGFSCTYQLQNFELKQLRQKFDECVLMPTSDKRQPNPKRNEFNVEEELFKCKTERCSGNWFFLKTDSLNLFRCPVCNVINCVHCKAIHNNMSCTEFKNNRVQPATLLYVVNKLNNMVLSYKQEGRNTYEPRQIRDETKRESNETLMQCKKLNCVGQWFVSKIDRNSLFKCPICELYNCAKCKAIHQNQTCDEYQEAERPEFNFRNVNVADPEIKNVARQWSCNRCTYINLGFGNTCQMCKTNNDN